MKYHNKKIYGFDSLLLNFLIRKFGTAIYWLVLTQSFLCFLCFLSKQADASEVVAVLEGRQWPYEKALEGIKKTCSCTPEVYYLQEIPSVTGFKKKVRSLQPRLLLAVGSKSLKFLLSNDMNLPVVYSMVLNPWALISTESTHIAGVSMNIDPKVYWEAMQRVKPAIKNVGIVYNPTQTQILKDHAEKLAIENGQKLYAIPAQNPKEALRAIKEIVSKIDAFWMIPDKTLIRQEITDTLVSYSFEKRFVLIGLSKKYVKAGALMAFSFDSKVIGKEAGKIANKILNNSSPMENNMVWAPGTELTVNLKTAGKIGVVIDPSFLKQADSIIE